MSSTKVLALCAAPERQRLKPGRIMRMDVKQMANLLSRRSLVLSGLASAVLANTTARAAELLTFVSPFEAGSAPDLYARIVAPEIGKLLGRTIVVENKQGAGGNI